MKKIVCLLTLCFLTGCGANTSEVDSITSISPTPAVEELKIDDSMITDLDVILVKTNMMLKDMAIDSITELPQITYEKKENEERADFTIPYKDVVLYFSFYRMDWLDNVWNCAGVNDATEHSKFYWITPSLSKQYDLYSPDDGSLITKATEDAPSLDEIMDDFYEKTEELTNEYIDSLNDLGD